MLKVQLISDTHHEFKKASKFIGSLYSANKPDVIVFAGDIDKDLSGLTYAAELVAKHDNLHVIYVPGNHEFYQKDMIQVRAAMRALVNDPMNSEAIKTRLHLLDNDTCIIGGVRFIGSTLWTDFELNHKRAKSKAMRDAYGLNDFRLIGYGDHTFTPEDSLELHKVAKAFIQAELTKHHYGKTVLVTHHLPSAASVAERFKNDDLSPCFASRMDDLVVQFDYNFHGHTHDNFCYFSLKHNDRIDIHHVADYHAGLLVEEIKPGTYGDLHVDFEYLKEHATLTLCNPRGYIFSRGDENSYYEPNLIIEI